MQALKTRLVYDQFIIIFYTNVLVLVRSAFVQGCGILTIFVALLSNQLFLEQFSKRFDSLPICPIKIFFEKV